MAALLRNERFRTIGSVTLAVVLVVIFGFVAIPPVIADRDGGPSDGLQVQAPVDSALGAGDVGTERDVVLIGDSITEGAQPVLEQTLAPLYHTRVRGRGGYRVDQMEPYAIELATSHPGQVIINLGTNDVLRNWPIDKSVEALTRMVNDFSDAKCLHLVTINQHFSTEGNPGVRERAIVFDLALLKLAASKQIDVIDWNRVVNDDLAAGSPNGPLTVDSVHPNARGQAVLAALYTAALARCS
jgi:lysophospholipase L1-like esterase